MSKPPCRHCGNTHDHLADDMDHQYDPCPPADPATAGPPTKGFQYEMGGLPRTSHVQPSALAKALLDWFGQLDPADMNRVHDLGFPLLAVTACRAIPSERWQEEHAVKMEARVRELLEANNQMLEQKRQAEKDARHRGHMVEAAGRQLDEVRQLCAEYVRSIYELRKVLKLEPGEDLAHHLRSLVDAAASVVANTEQDDAGRYIVPEDEITNLHTWVPE